MTWYALMTPARYRIDYDLFSYPMKMELCDLHAGVCTIVQLIRDRDGSAVFTYCDDNDGDVLGAAFNLPSDHPPAFGEWVPVDDPRVFPFPGVPSRRPSPPRDVGFPG